MVETKRAPHRWVADKMGYSIAGVSLLRSGHRQPNLTTMEAVERAFGWEICDQVADRGNYAEALEQRINQAYTEETNA